MSEDSALTILVIISSVLPINSVVRVSVLILVPMLHVPQKRVVLMASVKLIPRKVDLVTRSLAPKITSVKKANAYQIHVLASVVRKAKVVKMVIALMMPATISNVLLVRLVKTVNAMVVLHLPMVL